MSPDDVSDDEEKAQIGKKLINSNVSHTRGKPPIIHPKKINSSAKKTVSKDPHESFLSNFARRDSDKKMSDSKPSTSLLRSSFEKLMIQTQTSDLKIEQRRTNTLKLSKSQSPEE